MIKVNNVNGNANERITIINTAFIVTIAIDEDDIVVNMIDDSVLVIPKDTNPEFLNYVKGITG